MPVRCPLLAAWPGVCVLEPGVLEDDLLAFHGFGLFNTSIVQLLLGCRRKMSQKMDCLSVNFII
jgi:hypothetical protein